MTWMCIKCWWEGAYGELLHVTYHAVDWENCPSCDGVAIPKCGSTKIEERKDQGPVAQ